MINNKPLSHFEFYVKTIQSHPDSSEDINSFLSDLESGVSYDHLIVKAYIPKPVQAFLHYTKSCVDQSIIHCAAAFTFGRETLVPTLFSPLCDSTAMRSIELKQFSDYIHRHIELDGDLHGKLAMQLVENDVRTDSDWAIVKQVSIDALSARIKLWDYISSQIDQNKKNKSS